MGGTLEDAQSGWAEEREPAVLREAIEREKARSLLLAELGAKVLALAREREQAPSDAKALPFLDPTPAELDAAAWTLVEDAARSLGLLQEKQEGGR